jgi:hypothetical protein
MEQLHFLLDIADEPEGHRVSSRVGHSTSNQSLVIVTAYRCIWPLLVWFGRAGLETDCCVVWECLFRLCSSALLDIEDEPDWHRVSSRAEAIQCSMCGWFALLSKDRSRVFSKAGRMVESLKSQGVAVCHANVMFVCTLIFIRRGVLC